MSANQTEFEEVRISQPTSQVQSALQSKINRVTDEIFLDPSIAKQLKQILNLNQFGLQNPIDVNYFLNNTHQGKLIAAVIGQEEGLNQMLEHRHEMDNIRLQQQRALLKKYLLFMAAIAFSEEKSHASLINNQIKRQLNELNQAISNKNKISNPPKLSILQENVISALAAQNQISLDLNNAVSYSKYLKNRSQEISLIKNLVDDKLKNSEPDFKKAYKLLASKQSLKNNSQAKQIIEIFITKRDSFIESNFLTYIGSQDIAPNKYASSKLAAKHHSAICLLLTDPNVLKDITSTIKSSSNYQEAHKAMEQISKNKILQGKLLTEIELENYQKKSKNNDLTSANQIADLQLDFYSLYKENDNLKSKINELEKEVKYLSEPHLLITKSSRLEKRAQAQLKLELNNKQLDNCQRKITGLKLKMNLELSPKLLYNLEGEKLDISQMDEGYYVVPDNCIVKNIDGIVHVIEPDLLEQFIKSPGKQMIIDKDGELLLLNKEQDPNNLTKEEKVIALKDANEAIKQSHIGRQAAEGYALGGKSLEIAERGHSQSQKENQEDITQLQNKQVEANKNVEHAIQEHDASIASLTKNLENDITNIAPTPILSKKSVPALINEFKKIHSQIQNDIQNTKIYSNDEVNAISVQLRNTMTDQPPEIQDLMLKEYRKLPPAIQLSPLSSLPLGDPNAKENNCFDNASNNAVNQRALLDISQNIISNLNENLEPSSPEAEPYKPIYDPRSIPRPPGADEPKD